MEKIKEIVSAFINLPSEQIGPDTPINRSVIQSSILLHRMYARLAGEGIRITDYNSIKVFGDLWKADLAATNGHPAPDSTTPSTPGPLAPGNSGTPVNMTGIGIDIQDIASLPRTNDFRKEEFYKMNFSPEEIAYCILQPDPYASLTGLFAVKEAIVKAIGRPDGRSFDTIRITHSSEGKPIHPGFAISISHSAGLAVAVAVRTADAFKGVTAAAAGPAISASPGGKTRFSWVPWVALLLALAALSVVLIHRA